MRAPLALLAGPVHAGAQAQVAADQRLQIGRRRQLAVSFPNAFHPGFYQTPQVISLTLLTLVFLIGCTPPPGFFLIASFKNSFFCVCSSCPFKQQNLIHKLERMAFVICFRPNSWLYLYKHYGLWNKVVDSDDLIKQEKLKEKKKDGEWW